MGDRVTGALGDALRAVMLFLPKAVAFVAIVIVGWLIAKAVRKIVDTVLERVGFDRLVERGGVKTALARSTYDASDIVAKIAYYAIILFTLQLAFGVFGANPVSALLTRIIAWLPDAFVAIIIVVVAAAVARGVKDLIGNALGGLSYGPALASVASAFILGIGIIAALGQIGVATTVTTPILVAILATAGGVIIVGVGGGLIKPMQARAEQWLSRAEAETQAISAQTAAYQAGRRAGDAHVEQLAPPPDDTQLLPRADDDQPLAPSVAGTEETQVIPANRTY